MRSKKLFSVPLLICSICLSTLAVAVTPANALPLKHEFDEHDCLLKDYNFMQDVHITFYSGEECGYVCIDGTMEWDGNNYTYNLTFSSDFCNTFTVSGRNDDSGLPAVKGSDIRTSAISLYYINR